MIQMENSNLGNHFMNVRKAIQEKESSVISESYFIV